MQESARKDVERCFGVLQARFAIIPGSSRFWSKDDMTIIIKACIILHNMIVEDERDEHPWNKNTTVPIQAWHHCQQILHQRLMPFYDAIVQSVILINIISFEMILLSIYGSRKEMVRIKTMLAKSK